MSPSGTPDPGTPTSGAAAPGPGSPAGRAGLVLLPAVDVAGGRADQVVDGGSDDPAEMALRWVDAGASWVHLVDLDRAFGRGGDAALMATLVEQIPVPVQLSGGLADRDTVETALRSGAARVVLASSLLAQPELVADLVDTHGARVVPAVDVRAGRVVSRGTNLDLGPVEAVLPGHPAARAPHLLVADASRDGSRTGADLDLFTGVADLVAGEVIASGGVATLDDLRALAAVGGGRVTQVVLGAALYHGAFTLEEALEVCR